MMTIGILSLVTLILIGITLVVLIGILVAANYGRHFSRVDWSKVLFVFAGIPCLVLIIGGSIFAPYHDVVTVQQAAQAKDAKIAAEKELHELAAAIKEVEARGTQPTSPGESQRPRVAPMEIPPAPELPSVPAITPIPPVPAVPAGEQLIEIPSEIETEVSRVMTATESSEASASLPTSQSPHSNTTVTMSHTVPVPQQAMAVPVIRVSVMILFAVLAILGILSMTIGLKHSVLGAFVFVVCILSGGLLYHHRSSGQAPRASLVPADLFDSARQLSTTRPGDSLTTSHTDVDESDADEITNLPTKILEMTYHLNDQPSGTQLTRSVTELEQLPDWMQEGNEANVVWTSPTEMVLTSQRYSTVEEAEAQLETIARSQIVEFMAGTFPDMKADWSPESLLTSSELQRLNLLTQKCEITWPFQVGEFKDEMQQVVWKLNLNETVQKKFYANWQRDKRTERLALLGSGITALTILFGAGAVLSRPRDRKRAVA